MAAAGTAGLGHNVPPDLDPDNAVACMSIFGYDPKVNYTGRAPIQAASSGHWNFAGQKVVLCWNLVRIQNGQHHGQPQRLFTCSLEISGPLSQSPPRMKERKRENRIFPRLK